jgi:hypothetical protein
MELEFKISDTVIDGNVIARKVVFEGIEYLSTSAKHASIIWKVYLVDQNGDIIIHPDVFQGRLVRSPIENSNKVDQNGIMITREYTDTLFQAPSEEELIQLSFENETVEQTVERLKEEFYQDSLSKGFPEFDFYWSALFQFKLPEVLGQSIPVLDSLKRFDRI